ncbi:MAG: PorP/SprF family type IX secretion system membrane protein [Bacteroidales bacterium]|nr:PorP/SprF family type IX secretion system membrane protein [Bacteroidales bacterium]
MKKIGAFLLLLMLFVSSAFAQDDAQFTLFPWATMYYNPGAMGEQSNTLCFTGFYRQAYVGWQDVYTDENGQVTKEKTAPREFMFNIESYLRKCKGSFGLSILSDRVGFYNNVGIRFGYAYKLKIPTGHLGIGLQVSFFNQAIDGSKLHALQENDAVLTKLQGEESVMDFDINFGLFYKADRWNVGLSGTQLITKARLSGDASVINRSRQLYLHGGYIWILPWNPSWTLEPSALIKTDLKSVQFDLMLLTRYNGVFWGGLSYRIDDAVSLLFGARPFYNHSNNYLKGIDLGLAYGITTSKMGYKKDRGYGDIEIMIRYCFDIYKEEVFSGYGSTRNIYKNQY